MGGRRLRRDWRINWIERLMRAYAVKLEERRRSAKVSRARESEVARRVVLESLFRKCVVFRVKPS